MPVPVLNELRRRLPDARLYNGYGQSEIGPLATILKPEEHDERPASAGKPILNVRTRVVDPEMNDVGPLENGEIVHRSPQLMVGYWEKPEDTEQAFAGGWFHSGDLGYMDEGGYLYVVDRVKDVINTRGILVSGREVAVVALPDEKWIEAVSAVVVLKSGTEPDEALAEDLRARERLAPFKIPKHVFFVDDLPRNASGKILKRELRARFANEVEGSAAEDTARTL
jgi:fatty-acyl-CoA synthase